MKTQIRTLPDKRFLLKHALEITVKRKGKKYTANMRPYGMLLEAEGRTIRSVRDELREGLLILYKHVRHPQHSFAKAVKKKLREIIREVK